MKKKKASKPTKIGPKQRHRNPIHTINPCANICSFYSRDGGAHASFDDAMGDWPLQLAGVKVANFPHTAWMLLEHLRLAQWDILEFSRNAEARVASVAGGLLAQVRSAPE